MSFVIPTRNAGQLVEAAVESALAQTHGDVQVVVIDDGSTDGTGDRLSRYGSSLTYQRVDHEDRGFTHRVAEVRNLGLRLADGDFVAFLDADDLSWPDRVERQLECVERHPECALVYAQLDLISSNGDPVRSVLAPDTVGLGREGSHEVFGDLLAGNLIPTSSVLARTDCLRRVGGFDPGCVYAEDWELWLRMSSHWPVAFMPQSVGAYRVYPGDDALLRVFRRGKAAGLGEVVRRNLESAPIPADLADLALGLAYWRGALVAFGAGSGEEGLALLAQASGRIARLTERDDMLMDIVWTAAEGAAYSRHPLDQARRLVDLMVDGLSVPRARRRRIRSVVMGELFSLAAFRYRDLGAQSRARNCILRAMLANPRRAHSRGWLALLARSTLRFDRGAC